MTHIAEPSPRHAPHAASAPPSSNGRHRRRGRRSERIPSSEVAQILDELVQRLRVDRPYVLYRYLADRTDMHPTTVLRVHQGRLETAHRILAQQAEQLLEQVRAGKRLPIDPDQAWAPRSRPAMLPGRVPAETVRERIEQVLGALGKDEHQFLYRYLAQRAGIHPTTVLRYHRGELRTAPSRLLALLDDLQRRVASGEVVSFCRSSDGPEMVVREQVLETVDTVLDAVPGASKASLFRALDERLVLKPGTMARIYYDHHLRFVRADIHEALRKLVHCVEYDPCRTYQVGERIEHHLYGAGVVRQKVHKNKIVVDFHEGHRAILSEAVPQDPFLHVRSAGWGGAPHAGLATDGLAH